MKTRATPAGTFVGVLLALCQPREAHSQLPPVPPLLPNPVTALSAGPTSPMPDISGNFEDPTIPTFKYTPTWAPWNMGTGTGIANNGSGFTFLNPPAPQGTHVAFLQGLGAMSTPFTFPAGIWRLRFYGAQRKMSTGDNRQVLQVKIDALEVFEAELESTNYTTYSTRPMVFPSATAVTVQFKGQNLFGGDNTAFVDQIEAEPIADWNKTTSWSGGVPGPGSDVIIPAGVEVVMLGTGAAAATAATVSVSGELLTSFQSAALSARWVMVSGVASRFEVGYELAPFLQSFVLTLNGNNTTENVMNAGSKFLMAMDGGRIELHGKPSGVTLPDNRVRAWTHLAATVAPPFTQIVTAEAMPWQQYDKIVIAGSNYADPDNYQDQAEVREIVSVNGTTITLQPAPVPPQTSSYFHSGASLAYSNSQRSWTFDRRAEVGLLTHNVIVQGDVAAGPTFGGHVMLMKGGCCTSMKGGRGRFSNVEFLNMGQKQKLGRYPIHWHMQENQGAKQFAKCCSVWNSFNRAITIHGSESVLLEGNVAYNHIGHGIFFEDGSERHNKLYHNFALTTVKPPLSPINEALLPSDNSDNEMQNRTPATFWITNPNNTFVGNVAGGTIGTGYWFALPTSPTGLSHTNSYFAALNIQPDHEPIGLFTDNVAHSSASGIDANDSIYWNPNNPADPLNHTIVKNWPWVPAGTANQNFDRFTAYGCFAGIYTGFGGDVHDRFRFRECTLGDNVSSTIFAAYDVLESSLVVADSYGSSPAPVPMVTSKNAYGSYDGPARVYDTHYVGFTPGSTSFLFDIGGAVRHPNHRMHGLSFDPAQPKPRVLLADFASAYTQTAPSTGPQDPRDPRRWGLVIVDEDGTLSTHANYSLVANHPLLRSQWWDLPYSNPAVYPVEIVPQTPLPPSGVPGAAMSPFPFAHLRIHHHPSVLSASSPHVNLPNLLYTRFLTGEPNRTFLHQYNWDPYKQFPVMINPPGFGNLVVYRIDWPAVPPTVSGQVGLKLLLDDMDYMPLGSSLGLELVPLGDVVQAGGTGLTVKVNGNPVPVQMAASLSALSTSNTTGWFADTTLPTPRSLWVRFVNTGRQDRVELTW